MIKLVRVDHRLLHGQVIFSWTRQTAANHIIVADDLVPNDPIGKMALSLAKPSGCSLDIIPFSELKQAVESNADKNIMIIVRGPKEALRLSMSCLRSERLITAALQKNRILNHMEKQCT